MMMRLACLALLSSAAVASNVSLALPHACWQNTKDRGVGKPISACPDGQDKDAGLCYPKCEDGYKGIGPVCWENCPPGYTDDGATCRIPLKVISADNSACHWYDKCGLTYDKGCSKCPEGYTNDGCTCRIPLVIKSKKSYGRGVGKPLGCPKGQVEDASLCYPPCPADNWDGIGPICYEQCPVGFPKKCGLICGNEAFSCSQQVTDDISHLLQTLMQCKDGFSTACLLAIASELPDFTLDGLCAM